jgi:glycosyltransferase involved in cell wall biosynthesis
LLRDKGIDVEILNELRCALPSSEYRHATGRLRRLTLPYLFFRLPQRSTIFHFHATAKAWKSWLLIFVAGLAARLKAAPTILTLHSGLMPGYVRRFGKGRVVIARWVLRSFTRIVCVNQEIAGTICGLGVDAVRVRIIPAFLEVPEPGELTTTQELAVQKFHPLLVVVAGGDPDPELGPADVVHVLCALKDTFPRVGAVFIGWGIGPKTAPLIRHLGLTDHAACFGEVSHGQCLALLTRADVVVRSTCADGDAIAVREALAFGVPVVASETGFRPVGTILFRRGDHADLQRKLIDAVHRGKHRREAETDRTCPSADQLWQVYCEVGVVNQAS